MAGTYPTPSAMKPKDENSSILNDPTNNVSTSTRYEYLLLQERKIKQTSSLKDQESATNGSDSNNNANITSPIAESSHKMSHHASEVASRASRIGLLESQLYSDLLHHDDQNKDQRTNMEDSLALAALLEHTQNEYNETCWSNQPYLDQLHNSFEKVSICATLLQNESENVQKKDEDEDSYTNGYNLENPDVDFFFHNFPEYINDSTSETENNDSFDNEDDYTFNQSVSDNTTEQKSQILNETNDQSNSINHSSNQTHHRNLPNQVMQSPSGIRIEQTQQPSNPYKKNQRNENISSKPNSISNTSSMNSTKGSSSWDVYNSRNPPPPTIPMQRDPHTNQYPPQYASFSNPNNNNIYEQSNHSPPHHPPQPQQPQQPQQQQQQQHQQQPSKRNDFLTARELAQNTNFMEDNSYEEREYSNSHNSYNNLQPQQNYRTQGVNQYSNVQQQQQNESKQSQTSSLLRSPNISAGLKRKYKPPKLQPNKNNNNNINNNGAQGSNKKVLPSNNTKTKLSYNNVTNSNNNNSNNSSKNKDTKDDDELPEELQHLDKELVKKIEYEILDNSESVTFDDIAGLLNAKQTVLVRFLLWLSFT